MGAGVAGPRQLVTWGRTGPIGPAPGSAEGERGSRLWLSSPSGERRRSRRLSAEGGPWVGVLLPPSRRPDRQAGESPSGAQTRVHSAGPASARHAPRQNSAGTRAQATRARAEPSGRRRGPDTAPRGSCFASVVSFLIFIQNDRRPRRRSAGCRACTRGHQPRVT